MSTTYIGKIGRLPKSTRDELGRRIEDGEPGKGLVKWLNGLPRVQEILKEQFGGREITEQNLSEWKQGGHPDWLRREEARLLVAGVTEQHNELEAEADGMEISDRYGSILAAELIRMAKTLLEKETDTEKRWQRFREVHRELSQLRRDDHRADQTMLKRARWERETEREDEEDVERMKREAKHRLRSMCISELMKGNMAGVFGGGEYGKHMAEMLHRIEFDLPLDDLVASKSSGKTHANGIKPDQTESNPIQSNPTNFNDDHPPNPEPAAPA